MSRRTLLPSMFAAVLGLALIAGFVRVTPLTARAALQASPEATPCAEVTDEEASALATAFLNAFATGDTSVYDRILSPDFVHHWGVGEDATGIDTQKERVAAFAAAFDPFTFDNMLVVVANGYVTVQWTASGRQIEPLGGIAASDQVVSFTGINLFRIECGLIVEAWNETDHLGRLISAGVISEDELADLGTPMP